MTKKTRYFVLTAAAVLAVGLTTGLLASYMGLPVSVFSRAAGPDELQYVPADAAVVGYADVKQVMNSEFRERFRSLEPDSKERDEFEQKTGVNIQEDIHSVVVAVMPRAAGSASRDGDARLLVVARGRFEQSRLESLAIEHGWQVDDYKGTRLLTEIDERDGSPDMVMGFLATDLIAFGPSDSVKAAVDASAGGRNVSANVELMKQVGELEGNTAWAVGRFDALTEHAKLPSEVQAQIPTITWFSAAGHINGGLRGTFKAETRDEEAARNLRDVAHGLLALGRLQAGDRPGMKEMIDSLQIGGEGRTVSLAFSVPTEVLDALEALSKSGRSRDAAPVR